MNSFSQGMAAAEYYMERPNEEETLNIQARNIAQRILLLQAQLRGFLFRKNLHKKPDFGTVQGFPNEVVHDQRGTKLKKVSIDKMKSCVHDVSKYSLYPLISCLGGISEEANSIDLKTQCPEPAEILTNHRESGNY